MSKFETAQQEENPAITQIVALMAIIFILSLFIFSSGQNTSRDLITANDAPAMISNPQVDDNEAIDNNILSVPMFNLENPNGWATPTTVTLVGTFQDELGCDEDNTYTCNATKMTYDILGDIWRASFTIPNGSYNYHAYLDNTDQRIYGKNGTSGSESPSISFTLNRTQTVNFYYDHKTGWITDDINSVILTLPSNFKIKWVVAKNGMQAASAHGYRI